MITPFAPYVLRLLQGAIYDTDKTQWRELEQLQGSIGQYLAQLGLELRLDKDQGLAYVHQPTPSDEDYDESQPELPRLMRRHPLSYDLTMLCVALRQHLDHFDQSAADDTRRCYISRTELRQRVELFARPTTDEARANKAFEANVEAATKLSFLRPMAQAKLEESEPHYEILRLVTALISNAKLLEIRDRLRQHLATPTPAEPAAESSPTPTFSAQPGV